MGRPAPTSERQYFRFGLDSESENVILRIRMCNLVEWRPPVVAAVDVHVDVDVDYVVVVYVEVRS